MTYVPASHNTGASFSPNDIISEYSDKIRQCSPPIANDNNVILTLLARSRGLCTKLCGARGRKFPKTALLSCANDRAANKFRILTPAATVKRGGVNFDLLIKCAAELCGELATHHSTMSNLEQIWSVTLFLSCAIAIAAGQSDDSDTRGKL